MQRASGVLMHISTLFGDYSCGSFGKSAKYFVDFLCDCGFSYWQVLPFCMVDECNSPYKSYSAFGGNPYFIDLDLLYEEKLITEDELADFRQHTPYSCEFKRLSRTRLIILMHASKRADKKLREKVEAFCNENPYLLDCSKFMALKHANDQKPWNEWTSDKIDSDVLFMWKFIQYKFFTQWADIKAYANQKGVKLIGDVPIYVSYDSADVWANPELFLLDSDKKPTEVAGCPPDYFSADGQLWGNPIYDWKKMKSDGYSWWCDRIKHMLNMFDCVRIDHFRGFSTYWSIPSDAKTASEGHWEIGPGKPFIDRINEVRGKHMIIAEDLGEITKDVTELVNYSKFPGMRVLQFGFISDDDNPHQPHNYPNNSVAYTGTHDNNTLLGYVWELPEATRRGMLEYCGYFDENWDNCYDSIIRVLFESHAGLAILPIQDLLGYGSDTRLNVPGRAENNWQFRITKEQLDRIDREKYRRLNYVYRRLKVENNSKNGDKA